MRAVIQRVKEAAVRVEGQEVARIGPGLLALVGIEKGDTEEDRRWLAEKIAGLRIFEDQEGKMNLSVKDVSGEILLISNFTVCGDCRKGRRPSFDPAEKPPQAEKIFHVLSEDLRKLGLPVKTGIFGAYMEISLINDGPVTLILDSRKRL